MRLASANLQGRLPNRVASQQAVVSSSSRHHVLFREAKDQRVAPLPQDSENQRTGRQGAILASLFLEKLDFVVRQEAQETDFGSDLELELHDGTSVSGRILKCQVKGTREPAFEEGATKYVTIKASTRNYWAALPVNVVCILVDLSNDSIYWAIPDATLVKTENTSVSFRQADRADTNSREFMQAMNRLASMPTGSQILSQVVPALNLFNAAAGIHTATYDRGFEVESSLDGAVRVVYDHVERLCIFTGVRALPAPWLQWERRNAVLQNILDSNDSGLLDGNVATEAVRYLVPFYEAALTRLVDCVSAADIEDTVPQLAELVESGALERESLRKSFSTLQAGGPFVLDERMRITRGQNVEHSDLDFDNVLSKAEVNYYNLIEYCRRVAERSR